MTALATRMGPGAARALGGGEGRVEIVLDGGGYLRLGERGWLLLAPECAPFGPLSVLVRGLRPLRAGAAVAHTGDALEVGELRIELRRAAAGAPNGPPPLREGWRAALDAALAECPEPCIPIRANPIEAMAGLGPGLTPAGDDVLAGYAAWRHADGLPTSLNGDRCSPIGRAYLRCAERGELPDVAARALAAIRIGDTQLAVQRARALNRWGASSGSAILWGMAAAAGARP
jgi:hypothetical protein